METTFGLARVGNVSQSILQKRPRNGKASFAEGLLFSGEFGKRKLMLQLIEDL